MSNSPLVTYTKISPNSTNPRKDKIKNIVIHHMAGNLTVEQCGNIFATKTRNASSNYGVGTDGRVALYVDEKNRAWTTSNAGIDNQSVTMEVANSKAAEPWPVSDKALQATIDLCYDICKRNDIKSLNFTGDKRGNLLQHNYFHATACPGTYLKGKFKYIADEVNKWLQEEDEVVTQTKMLMNGKEQMVDRIIKGGQNYVLLQDLNKFGICDVSYDAAKKLPIVSAKK